MGCDYLDAIILEKYVRRVAMPSTLQSFHTVGTTMQLLRQCLFRNDFWFVGVIIKQVSIATKFLALRYRII